MRIAINTPNRDSLGELAFGLITDEETLASVALKKMSAVFPNSDKEFAESAAERITSQALLVKIATSSEYRNVRLCAVRRLESDDALKALAMQDEDREVAVEAGKKITREHILSALAERSRHLQVALEAVARHEDKQALLTVAEKSIHWQVRIEAVKRIENKSALQQILQSDIDVAVSRAAWERLATLGVSACPPSELPADKIEEDLLHLPVHARASSSEKHEVSLTLGEAATILRSKSYSGVGSLHYVDDLGDGMRKSVYIYRTSRHTFVLVSEVYDNSW